MRAEVGSRITVRGRKVGDPNRHGEIVEVRGADGTPPYLIRWDDGDGAHLMYPGSDAIIEQSVPG
ncbi:MAG: DUF1918 domain-containing protein [Acidimicrobiales bacterium]